MAGDYYEQKIIKNLDFKKTQHQTFFDFLNNQNPVKLEHCRQQHEHFATACSSQAKLNEFYTNIPEYLPMILMVICC